ncbi:hypothetical protein RFI_26472 [Reticulomyxa filosa]|uniref:Uncharacterized protein n=1 Tax=Reticulomyxa filosa TaxID=46433 RepID=X6MD08_RETFI|nr:hypothetical protein RFI_26472 [Reticulomyxa filosa]|eukprot:ETO10905.1 hypothetical protein RFI_26472 [Reticulomyxa filosa]
MSITVPFVNFLFDDKHTNFLFFKGTYFLKDPKTKKKTCSELMAQESTTSTSEKQEIGQKNDWSELYWGGFGPHLIGAVPLVDATSNEANLKKMIKLTEAKIKEEISGNEQLQKKGVTIEDYFVTFQNENSKDDNEEIWCCHLWHKNVFVGARNAGVANPGAFNFIARYKTISANKNKDKTNTNDNHDDNDNSLIFTSYNCTKKNSFKLEAIVCTFASINPHTNILILIYVPIILSKYE